ncbi:MAG: hypothetical protein M1812_003579 [Candelaria pacifica]|nr:MAG: hypothetical protein M1812_003579 [Candelaria pacifica]
MASRGFYQLVRLTLRKYDAKLRLLSDKYLAIKGALGVLGLDTFLISDLFPAPDQRFDIGDTLTGLGTILSVVSGFVPVIGPGIAAAGASLPTIGTFLSSTVASKSDQVLVGQREFAPKVREIYTSYIDALDETGRKLFKGESINTTTDSFNITDMMTGGAWVNVSALTPLAAVEKIFTVEILSRSIDALWKTPTSIKMWVLFVDLQDDPVSKTNCLVDRTGPQDSKYCDDHGVYYTYNYLEEGDKRGSVGYPWGGNLLQDRLGINLAWLTEASAKSYRLAKRNSIDPFNVSGIIGTQAFPSEAVRDYSE